VGAPPQQDNHNVWEGKPALAFMLRAGVFAAPIIASIIASIWLSRVLPTPESLLQVVGWWAAILVVSTAVLFVVDKAARRFLPLATLMQLTMVFPDKAPSRIRVAMRSSSDEELRRTMNRVQEAGLGSTANEAAETLMVLVAALNRHDRRTRGHSERTRAYADVIAGEMGLTTEDRSKLRWAALLHDVGQMQIPGEILHKPGQLTATGHGSGTQHPGIGGDLVVPLRDFLGPRPDTVAQHHDRWDGAGFPYNL